VLVKDALANRVACTIASTNPQPKPAAKLKTAVSATSFRR